MMVVQTGQIGPHHPPGTGGFDLTVRLPGKPLGMRLVQAGRPTGVIDGNIDEKARSPGRERRR